METNNSKKWSDLYYEFKIDLIVWKLPEFFNGFYGFIVFKIDLIVWKQFVTV